MEQKKCILAIFFSKQLYLFYITKLKSYSSAYAFGSQELNNTLFCMKNP